VPSAALARRTLRTRALVVRRTQFRESDLIVSLFTERLGAVTALARGARRSQRRFGGTLEPLHTLNVLLDEITTRELLGLREANIEIARRRLTLDLAAMEAAGRALGWVRRAAPPHTPEPEVWRVVCALLDRLDASDDDASPAVELAECGLRLLAAFGWGIDFERCVVSGRACQPGQAAMLDPIRGGLVSRGSGGGPIHLDGATRQRLARVVREPGRVLVPSDVEVALQVVEAALRAHAGGE
jgi:DNA repair protein RecO (recombination protein O)